jgi:hypothetical protein
MLLVFQAPVSFRFHVSEIRFTFISTTASLAIYFDPELEREFLPKN